MAMKELAPPSTTDRISVSQHKRSGKITIAISAETAKRNNIAKGTALRVFVDLDATQRALRIEVDKDGPFKATGRIAGSVAILLPNLPELPLLAEKAYVKWDEGNRTIDFKLPAPWQKREPAAAGNGLAQVPIGKPGPALAPRRG